MLRTLFKVLVPLLLFPSLAVLANHFLLGHLTSSGGAKQFASQCSPNHGPYNLIYTGIPSVDLKLCFLVSFFHPALQPVNLPLTADFGASLTTLVALTYLEAARQSPSFIVAFPAIVGTLYQNLGGGFIFPLYWLGFIFSGHATTRPGPKLKIDQAHAEATLFALLIGYVVASGLMYGLQNPLMTAAWQAFPVWVSLAQVVYLLFRPSSGHSQSGYKTVQATYIFTFLLSAIAHLVIVWPLLDDYGALKHYYIPPVAVPAPQVTTGETAALVFLQWDVIFCFISSLLTPLWFAESVKQASIILLWGVVATIAFGPGAAVSGIFMWREAQLNGRQGITFSKKEGDKKDR